MLLCACVYGVKSEIRKSKISLDPGDSVSNAVVKRSVLSVFINQRCAECVCLYTMDFVSEKILLLYVTVCEKIPRLNKHDNVIE